MTHLRSKHTQSRVGITTRDDTAAPPARGPHGAIVAFPDLRYGPDKARLVFKAPRAHDFESRFEESVRRPQMQMGLFTYLLPDWFVADLLQRHRWIIGDAVPNVLPVTFVGPDRCSNMSEPDFVNWSIAGTHYNHHQSVFACASKRRH